MKTIARPTGTTTSQTPKMTAPRIVSRDAERHIHWIYRNTIWQSYYTDDIDGVPCLVISTPFGEENAINLMTGKKQPMSVTENDIVYDKDAAFAELATLLENATVEKFKVKGCGIWTHIIIRNVKFYWQK